MKPTQFYADETTLNDGIVCTKWIPDIFSDGNLQPNIAESYILGYIPYDDSPQSIFDLHTISMSNNLTSINFNALKQNKAWGYCWQNATGTDTVFRGQAYGLENDNSLFTLSSNTAAKIRFTNSVQYSQLLMVDIIKFEIRTFCFATSAIDENGNAHNGSTYRGSITTDFTLTRQQLHDFLSGFYTITGVRYHRPISNDDYTTTLDYADFDINKGIAKKVVDTDYTLYIIIDGVSGSSSCARYSYYNGSIWTYGAVNLTPFILYDVDEAIGFTPQKIIYTPLGFAANSGGQPRFTLQNSKESFAPSPAYSTNYHCIKRACTSWYGDIGTVNLDDFSKTSGIHYEMIRERCFLYFSGGDGNTFEFVTIVKPLDIYKAYLLLNAINSGITTQPSLTNPNPPNYSSTQTVALFTEDNTPKYEYEQGDIAQAAVPAILQPWQMPNAYNYQNDFEIDDIPPYSPTPIDDGENIGDKINRPASIGVGGTNGFVTQYALNRSDVAQLGALLWTSFIDQDYWQNYLFSLALDTGSLNLSSLLNFFVSLKVYPFSLINVAGCYSWGQDMYIGTGIVPLHFNTAIRALTSYADYISGGYIEIPRYFNDYRDYINTEIILYLPFCGTVQLNPGDVIGNRIDIQYAIDFASGGCIAYVDLTTGDGAGYPVGALAGQIGFDIPLTATAAGEVAARFIGDALNVAGQIGGEVSRTASGVAGAMGGNPAGGSGGGSTLAGIAGMYGGAGAAMAADLAPGLARQGLQMLQRGAVSAPMLSGGRGFAAMGAPMRPYVQIRRGIYPEIAGLHTVDGAPAAATATISTLSGFIQGSVKADGLSCHQAEKDEIIALIASGIYV